MFELLSVLRGGPLLHCCHLIWILLDVVHQHDESEKGDHGVEFKLLSFNEEPVLEEGSRTVLTS